MNSQEIHAEIRSTRFELILAKMREWIAIKLMQLAAWVAKEPTGFDLMQ